MESESPLMALMEGNELNEDLHGPVQLLSSFPCQPTVEWTNRSNFISARFNQIGIDGKMFIIRLI